MRTLQRILMLCAFCAATIGLKAQEARVTDTYHCGIGLCSVTFDSTSLGGEWSCWGPQGSCGPGVFANHFDAACAGGSADIPTALAAWWGYGHGLGQRLAKLRIPSGARCAFGTNQSLVCDTISDNGDTLIHNALIWGYGAAWDRMQLGGNGFIADGRGQGFASALIDEAGAGDAGITVLDGNAWLFAAGDWIIVSGLAGQGSGFGPTHQVHEHRQITSINGTVLALDRPLDHSYLTTWPNFNTYNPGQGGPAQIYKMANCFDTTVTYAGLTLTTSHAEVQNNMTGRAVTLKDMTVSGGLGPGGMISGALDGGWYATLEVDKDNDQFELRGVVVQGNVSFQSASTTPSLIVDSHIIGSIVGTPADLTIKGSIIDGDLQVGATCCGMSHSLTLDTVHYGNGRPAGQEIPRTALAYDNAGIFTLSLGALQTSNFPGLFVPGHTYFLGDSHGDNTCTPRTDFSVRHVVHVDDGTVQVQTNLTGPLPVLACGDGLDFSTLARYALMRLDQKNVSYDTNALLWNSKVLAPQ